MKQNYNPHKGIRNIIQTEKQEPNNLEHKHTGTTTDKTRLKHKGINMQGSQGPRDRWRIL